MKLRIRQTAGILAVVAGTTISLAAPAGAITGGEADGNGHPGVANILFYEPDGRFRCTATLISPTVLITAAHCTAPDVGKVLVDFRSVVALAPPSGYPVAA